MRVVSWTITGGLTIQRLATQGPSPKQREARTSSAELALGARLGSARLPLVLILQRSTRDTSCSPREAEGAQRTNQPAVVFHRSWAARRAFEELVRHETLSAQSVTNDSETRGRHSTARARF